MREYSYASLENEETVLVKDAGRVWLHRLCGMTCGNDGNESGPADTQGSALLVTNLGRIEGDGFQLVEAVFGTHSARIVHAAIGGALRLETFWSFCAKTGVVSRKDRLWNDGADPVTLFRIQSRFTFPTGCYEVYAQQSRWCNENQGEWIPLHAGSLRFGGIQGRTTQGGTPYMALRPLEGDWGIAFHVLPRGNWSIEVSARPSMDIHPWAIVQLGLSDDDLRMELPPGESFDCPEILIQALPRGDLTAAASRLHHWFCEKAFTSQRAEVPVVYNTWFDQFEVLDLERLRRQLQAAKKIGCEVFVIDAGWYGPQTGDWFAQAGDWREKRDGAFYGKMSDFAKEVRAAGLGFGLWMEPERFGPDVPVRKEHPEWFEPGQPPFARINLQIPAAFEYLRTEISRLVELYDLVWMKIDFNYELGLDRSGTELSGYYAAWYRLLDEICQKYPQTVFEGCASGAMRLDLESLAHFDAQFLSDTVNPVDTIRIWQGALLRLPPGGLTRWAVLRPIGRTVPRYTKSLSDSPPAVITPCGALWEPSETAEVDFIAAAAMPGIMGFSGDLAGLDTDIQNTLAKHVAFYKQWRQAIRRSVAHLLSPPAPKTDREGWAAVQLTDPETKAILLFVYRLNDGSAVKRFFLRDLDAQATYRISPYLPSGSASSVTGEELIHKGIEVVLSGRYQAMVSVVLKEP